MGPNHTSDKNIYLPKCSQNYKPYSFVEINFFSQASLSVFDPIHLTVVKPYVELTLPLKALLRDSKGQSLDQDTLKVSFRDSEGQSLDQKTLKASLRDSDGKSLDQDTLKVSLRDSVGQSLVQETRNASFRDSEGQSLD